MGGLDSIDNGKPVKSVEERNGLDWRARRAVYTALWKGMVWECWERKRNVMAVYTLHCTALWKGMGSGGLGEERK
jgi:hypothetical protein